MFQVTNDSNRFYINNEEKIPEIRVMTDSIIEITFENKTDYDFTIHFHGIRGESKMDGVGGLTQNAIKTNDSYTYKFYLDDVGTYMFHSHVNSNNQVNNELLFGTLVVENKIESKIENKDSIIYNEIYLNIVNMSSSSLEVYFGKDIKYKVKNVDTNEVNSKYYSNSTLIIPTANRVEITIENPQKNFTINFGSKEYTIKSDEKNKVQVNESFPDDVNYLYDIINMTESLNLENEKLDKKFNMKLDMKKMNWVINGEAYPNTKPLIVDEGDIVEITLDNSEGHINSSHPFHLHGHEFQVVELNGEKLNKNIVLDTLDVLPNSIYKIKFIADNPGLWAFHCHNLEHADQGMVTTLEYNGYTTKVDKETIE